MAEMYPTRVITKEQEENTKKLQYRGKILCDWQEISLNQLYNTYWEIYRTV